NFRTKKPSSLNEEIEVSFADGYPYLIIGTASIDDLNHKIGSPVDINRFRPNILINTKSAFEEDLWKVVSIGESDLQVV
ncbi:MAG: MOSC domain-containing protein, partial [Saprospiraceae bacterium]|nr:MOSC domain-containing protein [Saprospiraceae bacterium]